jgi:hypothetical protein
MAHHAVSAVLMVDETLYSGRHCPISAHNFTSRPVVAAAWDGAVNKWNVPAVQEKVANFVPEPVVETVVIEKSAQAAIENNASIFDETDCELLD